MAEMKGHKKRLPINLSFLSPSDKTQTPIYKSTKSFKKFEGGVVGLGILAAMNESDHTHDPIVSTRPGLLSVSPRSNPIPIFGDMSGLITGKDVGSNLEDGMELSEEYTCVISHIGNNMIKKREYFDGNLTNKCETTVCSEVFCTASLPVMVNAGEPAASALFGTADFLSSCYLCKKQLHGLDIFMYRGEKAFCSAECRHKQISADERKEKRRSSGVKNPHEYSASPYSSEPMQFFAGVAAA